LADLPAKLGVVAERGSMSAIDPKRTSAEDKADMPLDTFALRSSLERRQMIGAIVPIPQARSRSAQEAELVLIVKVCALLPSDV
jgi:hypothetical protein